MSDVLPPTSFHASATLGAMAGALAKAQGEIRNPGFDRVNPHFKNRYATLGAHLDAVRGPLSKHGIALVQTIATPDREWVTVSTMLIHSSGEWISCEASVKSPPNIQQMGSNITYLRRYVLAAVVGIVGDEDDDAETDRRSESPRQADQAPPAPRQAATMSSAQAKALMKALFEKGIPFEELMATMRKSGINPTEDMTTWLREWEPRVRKWIDSQISRKPSAEPTVDATG